MYINVQDKKEYTQDFINYLNKRMVLKGMEYLNQKRAKLASVNNYLKQIVFTGIRKPTAEQIVISGLNNFMFRKVGGKLIISINESVKVPQNDSFLLSSICQLIDQGNLEITPFPVFTYVLNYVLNNLSQIYLEYVLGIPM